MFAGESALNLEARRPAASQTSLIKKRAPTLYIIIGIKLCKGLLFVSLAIIAYALSDNDLPTELHRFLHFLRLNPERKFWADLAVSIGSLSQSRILWTAAGTLVYSMFSLIEGIGLMFRISWAGWMAIGESAFFIPIEIYELMHGYEVAHRLSPSLLVILGLNVMIVWYLFQNRHRLFRHHHH